MKYAYSYRANLTEESISVHPRRTSGRAFNRDPNVLRKAIVATVEALATGKIKPEEMPVDPKTNQQYIRYASGRPDGYPYTMDSIATFLGQVGADGPSHPYTVMASPGAFLPGTTRRWQSS
jgi:hypothetical protein